MSLDSVDVYFSIVGGILFGVFMGTTFTRVAGRTLLWPMVGVWFFFFAIQRIDEIFVYTPGLFDNFLGTTARWGIFVGATLATNAIVHRVRHRRMGL